MKKNLCLKLIFYYAQAKKQNHVVFWKIGVSFLGILKYSLVIQKYFFSYDYGYGNKLLWKSEI